MAKGVKGFAAGRIYAVTPPDFEADKEWLTNLRLLLAAGGVCCLQLRLKTAAGLPATGKIADYTPLLKEACSHFRVPLVVNDLPQPMGDGFHLGATDPQPAALPAEAKAGKIIGISCQNDIKKAHAAAAQGADYVAFGAFFATATKANAVPCPRRILGEWRRQGGIPAVAIGGITAENCRSLREADYLAVSSYLWRHPKGAVSALESLKKSLKAPPKPGGN